MYFSRVCNKIPVRHIQGELSSSEERLRGFQSEARQLKSSLRKYENLVEKYKKKVQTLIDADN